MREVRQDCLAKYGGCVGVCVCARALTFYYDQQQPRRRCGPPVQQLPRVYFSTSLTGGKRNGWGGAEEKFDRHNCQTIADISLPAPATLPGNKREML